MLRSPDTGSGWRHGVIVGILYTLAVAVGLWTIDWQGRQVRESERDRTRDDLRQVIGHLERLSRPEQFVAEQVERYCRALRWGRQAAARIGSASLAFGQLFVFDAAGKRIELPGTTSGLNRASELALRLILARRASGQTVSVRDERMIQGLIGGATAVDVLAQAPDRLVDLAAVTGRKLLAGVFSAHLARQQRVQVLAIFDRNLIDDEMLARRAVERFARQRFTGAGYGLTDLAQVSPPLHFADHDPATHAQLADRAEIEHGARLYLGAVVGRRQLLGVSAPMPAPYRSVIFTDPTAVAVVTLLGALLVAGILARIRRRGLPLRVQVLILVALASLGGLLAVLGFAGAWLKGREDAIIRERQQTAETLLIRADRGFQDFSTHLARQLQDLADQLRRCKTESERQRVMTRIKPAWRQWLHITATDADGRILAVNRPMRTTAIEAALGRETESALGRIALACWRIRLFREHYPGSKLPREVDSEPPMIRFTARSLFDSQGKISTVELGSYQMRPFLSLGHDANGVGQCLLVFVEKDIDQRLYLRRMHRSWRSTGHPAAFSFTLVGLPVDTPQTPTRVRHGEPDQALRRLHALIGRTRSVQELRTRVGTDEWLLVGRPGQLLNRFHLVVKIPLAPIRGPLQRLHHLFQALAVILGVFALVLGTLFSELILQPLQVLFHGLDHLAASRFAHRVKMRTGDELDELADGVNLLLEEMEQVAAGGKIHQQLMPRKPVTRGTAQAMGWSRSPAQIGNELFDTFTVAEDRIGILLMCIPDRAIASALVLAGAKAHARLAMNNGLVEPATALTAIENDLLHDADPHRRAQVLLGCLDTSTRRLSLAWRGQFRLTMCGQGVSMLANGSDPTTPATHAVDLPPGVMVLVAGEPLFAPTPTTPTGIPTATWLHLVTTAAQQPLAEVGAAVFAGIDSAFPELAQERTQTFVALCAAAETPTTPATAAPNPDRQSEGGRA